jgi:hypothetical protein
LICRLSAAVVLVCACLSACAHAAPSVTLNAALMPELLGHGTTIGFGLQIATPGEVPPPITEIDLRYPANLGIALSGLGLSTCSASALEARGPKGCPVDSRMGSGTAIVEVPLGLGSFQETAQITIFRAPTEDGHLALIFNVEGNEPVSAQIVLPGLLLPTAAPYGGIVHIAVPLVPSLPAGPDVSVVQLQVTLGPRHIIYYERSHGRTIPYRPKGILLPDNCPRGGFPFAATLAFFDGSHTDAVTAVPCPSLTGDRRRSRVGGSRRGYSPTRS